MNDQIIHCTECGNNFVWTTGEQARGEPRPARCPVCCQLAPAEGRQRGVIKWFSRAKGYGFITSTQGGELFVHKSGLAPDAPLPFAGQLVEFSVGRGPRGPQAEGVVVLRSE